MNAGLSKLLETGPINSVRLVIRLRAITFGWYPSACESVRIFFRVAGATLAPCVKVRDTAEMDTPVWSATWRAVAPLYLGLLFTGDIAVHFSNWSIRYASVWMTRQIFEVVGAGRQPMIGRTFNPRLELLDPAVLQPACRAATFPQLTTSTACCRN